MGGSDDYLYDAFLSYASEDRQTVALPLAEELRRSELKIWFDLWELRVGSILTESISEGMNKSRFGIVILSKNYFAKHWPKKELNSILASESSRGPRILPIWHEITSEEVMRESAFLADRVALVSSQGIGYMVSELSAAIRMSNNPIEVLATAAQAPPVTLLAIEQMTKELFPYMGINPYWQSKLLHDINLEKYPSIEKLRSTVARGLPAAEAYYSDHPRFFSNGTDFITKSLGFVDLDFRRLHSWSLTTLSAFDEYQSLVLK